MTTAVVIAIAVTCIATVVGGIHGVHLSRTTSDFYVAGRTVTPWRNAFAIGGEYLSAASFLGIAGLVYASGVAMLWFPVGYTLGYVILAAVIAAHPWRRTIERAITEYSTPARQLEGTTTRGQVKDFITDTSRAGTADQINQAANIAIGQGRIDASDELDPLVDYYLASEVMDGNSCNPCRAVDGTRFPTLEEARKLYGRGYYEQCEGGARCRGKVLAVFPAQG